MPVVSIIVPVYNVEAYLQRCVDSILAQTFTDFELILVDDGSTDSSPAICDTYAARDARVIVIHKKNGGVSSARNTALGVANGTYVVFVDSDDTVSQKYLEELMQWSAYDYVTAGFVWQDCNNEWHQRIFPVEETTVNNIRRVPSRYLGKYYFGSPWAKLMKRSLIEKNKLRFNETVHCGEDTLFILEYLKYASSVKLVSLCGYSYHYYGTSLANKTHDEMWRWSILIEDAFSSFFEPQEGVESVFLFNRQFDILLNLIDRYHALMASRELLVEIYRHPFFGHCIEYKAHYGNVQEKLFIYSMEHNGYEQYQKNLKWLKCLSRLKRKMTGKL